MSRLTQLEEQGLYKSYFQKSKSFLFPALAIHRTAYTQPLQTYISWKEGLIKETDCKLICLYQGMDTDGFRKFEASQLFGNPLFETMYPGKDMKNIYIFNLQGYSTDWKHFLKGEYSRLSVQLKRAIQKYWGLRSNEYVWIDSYIFPDQYYEIYSKLLDVNRELLEKRGELCDPYNPEKETLHFTTTDLEVLERNS